jgi:hypothetical protein
MTMDERQQDLSAALESNQVVLDILRQLPAETQAKLNMAQYERIKARLEREIRQ